MVKGKGIKNDSRREKESYGRENNNPGERKGESHKRE